MLRLAVSSLVVGLAVLFSASGPAHAQDTKRVVVMNFRGPSSGPARNAVVTSLKGRSGVQVVPASELGGATSGSALRDAAAEAQVSAVVEGKVAKMGKFLRVTVTVRDMSSGDVAHEGEFVKKKNQLKSLKGAYWSAAGSSIKGTSPPEKPAKKEPEPEKPVATKPVVTKPEREEREEKKEPEEREEREAREARVAIDQEDTAPSTLPADRSARHPALIASVGPRMMWRSLGYDGSHSLSSYSSYGKDGGSPAFNAALNVLWFPGAHYRSDWVSNLGLEGDLDYSIGLKSSQGGKELDTTAYEFSAGAVYRHPLESFEPRVRLNYLSHTFDADVPAGTQLPAVSYSAVRLGVGTLVNIVEAFNFDVSFGYLIVLDTGEIGTSKYGSDLSAGAWEIGGGATFRFKEVYGVRAGVDFRRYNLDFGDSENANVTLPKSATDDYMRATVSFVYFLPGVK